MSDTDIRLQPEGSAYRQQLFSVERGEITRVGHKYCGKLTPEAIKLVDETEALRAQIELGKNIEDNKK